MRRPDHSEECDDLYFCHHAATGEHADCTCIPVPESNSQPENLDQVARDLEVLTAAAFEPWPSSAGVHTCHHGCPCHAGGEPVPDFEARNHSQAGPLEHGEVANPEGDTLTCARLRRTGRPATSAPSAARPIPPESTIDLRLGFKVEVTRNYMPAGTFSAQLYERREGVDRKSWKKCGPLVIADGPERAASDLLAALNQGLLPGVEAKG